jgi:predicted NUDIX family phosphoesterase
MVDGKKVEKHKKLIMVVPRHLLFPSGHFEGFIPADHTDYESRILENYGFMTRGREGLGFAEHDPNYKQPVGYAILVNPEQRMVFGYQRASQDKAYQERRLQGKFSIGIGGHIERIDIKDGINPIQDSLLRELNEEVKLSYIASSNLKSPNINAKVLGYVNKEEGVHAVHFGVLYLVETDADLITPGDSEMQNGRLMGINELELICGSGEYEVEEWSRIALEPLREYFKKLQN